jgi:hypothetical protein
MTLTPNLPKKNLLIALSGVPDLLKKHGRRLPPVVIAGAATPVVATPAAATNATGAVMITNRRTASLRTAGRTAALPVIALTPLGITGRE